MEQHCINFVVLAFRQQAFRTQGLIKTSSKLFTMLYHCLAQNYINLKMISYMTGTINAGSKFPILILFPKVRFAPTQKINVDPI